MSLPLTTLKLRLVLMVMAMEFAVMVETLVPKTPTELMLFRSTAMSLVTKILEVEILKTPTKMAKVQTLIDFSSFS